MSIDWHRAAVANIINLLSIERIILGGGVMEAGELILKPIIDEAALIGALESNKILGAALDVFDVEPLPASHPFWKLKNVLLSPHSADHTPGAGRSRSTTSGSSPGSRRSRIER